LAESGQRSIDTGSLGLAAPGGGALGGAARPAFPSARPVSTEIVRGLIQLIDPAIAALCALLAYQGYLGGEHDELTGLYAFAIGMGVLLQVVIFNIAELYRFKSFSHLFMQMRRVALGWTLVFAILIALAFFAKSADQFSRGWLTIWYFTGLGGLMGCRVLLYVMFSRWARQGRVQRRAVIIGAGEDGHRLLQELQRSAETEIAVTGFFDDRSERVANRPNGYPKLGRIDDVVAYVRANRIDLILVALPMQAETRILEILQKLSVLPVDIRLGLPTTLRFSRPSYSFVGNVPMLNMLDKPMGDWGYVVKTIEDKAISAVLLLLALPLMLMIAAAIKLDSRGPVFFRQQRYGFNNELIQVYKFRSLYHNRQDIQAEKLVTRNDPRVTRVGAFLRKTSLDELPQFINVLTGQMSIVGPRAHALRAKAGEDLYEDVVDGYFARHRVKPGITGWAQVNGWRGETDTPEKIHKRIEHDLYYIENWSLGFDLKIILMTPLEVFRLDRAY